MSETMNEVVLKAIVNRLSKAHPDLSFKFTAADEIQVWQNKHQFHYISMYVLDGAVQLTPMGPAIGFGFARSLNGVPLDRDDFMDSLKVMLNYYVDLVRSRETLYASFVYVTAAP